MKIIECPLLCGGTASEYPKTGDRATVICPNDGLFAINGTEEARCKNSDASYAETHRKRVASEHKRGIRVPKVGLFPPDFVSDDLLQ